MIFLSPEFEQPKMTFKAGRLMNTKQLEKEKKKTVIATLMVREQFLSEGKFSHFIKAQCSFLLREN